MSHMSIKDIISTQIRQWLVSMKWIVGSLIASSAVIMLLFSGIGFMLNSASYL